MNKRLSSIVSILLRKNDYVTIDSISKELKVCNKTIRNDLVTLDNWLREMSLDLDKKPGVGVAILGDENIKLRILNDVVSKENVIESYSPEDRKLYILKKLFSSNSTIKLQSLSKELYVSRATIHKDLISVEVWLKRHKIILIRNSDYFLFIDGKEKNIRKAICSLIQLEIECTNLSQLLQSNDKTASNQQFASIENLIDVDFVKLQNVVLSVESLTKYNLSDDSIMQLLILIAVSMKRIKIGHSLTLSDEFLKELQCLKEFTMAKDLTSSLEESFGMPWTDDEAGHILVNILGSKTNIASHDSFLKEGLSDICNKEATTVAKALIAFWEKDLDIPLTEDSKLLCSLTSHLNPAITRIKYGLPLNNPLLSDICDTYPNTFKTVKRSAHIFNEFLGVDINDDEIGYLTLHLACSIDRLKAPLKTVVVCHSGVGACELLLNKINFEFNELKVIALKSATSLASFSLSDVDLIISTVPLDLDSDIRKITINPLLTKSDMLRLKVVIKEIYSQKNSPEK